MFKDAVSILVVDSGSEVRELVAQIFQNFHVTLADPMDGSHDLLFGKPEESWPDIVILAQEPSSKPTALTELLYAPHFLEKVSVVVFPTFAVPLSRHPNRTTVCRLHTVSNLLQVIRGLAHKKAQPLRAV